MADSLSHARHDRFAIAAALGGGDAPSTVVTCPHCGALHRDLISIQTALRHAWTPKRPRDLRLDASLGARLRPALWRRLLGVVGSPRDVVTRPLAIGLTSIGIVGVVLTSSAAGLGAAGASAAGPEAATAVTAGPTTTPGGTRDAQERVPADPIVALSAGSLVAGGAVFGIRRLAARAKGVR